MNNEINLLDPINVILGDTQEFRGVNTYPTFTCGSDDNKYKISEDTYLSIKTYVMRVINNTLDTDTMPMITALTNGSLALKLTIKLPTSTDFKYVSAEEFQSAFLDIYENLIVLPKGVTFEKSSSVVQNPTTIKDAVVELAFTHTVQEQKDSDINEE